MGRVIVVLLVVLAALVYLLAGTCTAPDRAMDYAEDMGLVSADIRIDCQWTDSDGDGYRSCTIFMPPDARGFRAARAIECNLWGCRQPKAALLR